MCQCSGPCCIETTGFLQWFDVGGWLIWPVKVVPELNYKVPSGTLNLWSINQYCDWCACRCLSDTSRYTSQKLVGVEAWRIQHVVFRRGSICGQEITACTCLVLSINVSYMTSIIITLNIEHKVRSSMFSHRPCSYHMYLFVLHVHRKKLWNSW